MYAFSFSLQTLIILFQRELGLDDDEDEDNAENRGSQASASAQPKGKINKPASEMTPEGRLRADEMDLRCLDLCIGMLERVNGVCMLFSSQLDSLRFVF